MSENRRQILEMLSAGQITTDEAERLIAALEKGSPDTAGGNGSEPGPKTRPQFLRILVDAEEGHGDHGPMKVNMRVPMQLLRAGVRLAGLIPPPARQHVNEALHEQGVLIDLAQIKPENLEELVDQLKDLTIDVDGYGNDKDKRKNVKVRIFCE